MTRFFYFNRLGFEDLDAIMNKVSKFLLYNEEYIKKLRKNNEYRLGENND